MTSQPDTRFRRAIRVPRNLAGVLGAALFVGSIVSFAFLLLIEIGRGHPNPYVGLFHYMILPMTGTLGLALYVFGRWLRNRARARGVTDTLTSLTVLDLSQIENRQSILVITGTVAGGLVFLMSWGGVGAIQYTESEAFCGEVCHVVMSPEYISYQQAPHAAVPCVECHVGSGVRSFVEAKIRGIRQVVAVATNTYPRPIHTPITMRSPEETCESCHWSAMNREEKPLSRRYYLTEGFDEPWVLEMSLHLGGGRPESGFSEGAHWHNDPDVAIEYIAADDKRQEIAWVRFADEDGTVTEFRNLDIDFDAQLIQTGERVHFDCMTCHNRPAHQFAAPVEALNREFRIGTMNANVPGLRWLALESLVAEYATNTEAMEAIDAGLREGIEEEDPDWVADNPGQLEATIAVLQRLFSTSRFPEMNVTWREYPDNKKHWNSPGCFRCHSGNMVSAAGDEIAWACDTCHVIRGQGRVADSWQYDPEGLQFVHPSDEEVMEGPVLCHECHDGALGY